MRRIQRDICHEEFVKSLMSGDTPLFREIWRILLFAAALGINEGKRRPLEKVDSGKAMPETYFSTPAWRGLLYLIGICETNDSNCLLSSQEAQDKLVAAFEEYANAGLYMLQERMSTNASPLEVAVSLLLELSGPKVEAPITDELI